MGGVISTAKSYGIFIDRPSIAISAHIRMLISKRYQWAWLQLLCFRNGIASCLYHLISAFILLPLLKRNRFLKIYSFSIYIGFAWVVGRYLSGFKWSTWCCRGIPSYRYHFHVGYFVDQISFQNWMFGVVLIMRFDLMDIASISGDISARHNDADSRAISKWHNYLDSADDNSYVYAILLVTPCLLTRIREFIQTQHRNTTRGRRPSAVLWC